MKILFSIILSKIKLLSIMLILTMAILAIVLCNSFSCEIYAYQNDENKELNLSANSVCLMDVSSGRILYQKDEHAIRPVASTTKILTAHLAIKHSDLEEIVTTSEKAAQVEGSSLYLCLGEQMEMKDILYGLMLDSGNDAAHAIAEHISGSVSDFAQKMTKEAHIKGAHNSKFKNPHGLPHDNHYSTAYDMTLIARTALQNSLFSKIVSTENYQIPETSEYGETRYLKNDNKLLHKVTEIDGVKTGWTKNAGRCLVFSGSQNGHRVVGTVLNAPDMYQDAEKLLDYAFHQYDNYYFDKEKFITYLPVHGGTKNLVPVSTRENIDFLITESEEAKLDYLIDAHKELPAPIRAGEKVGNLKLVAGDQVLYTTALIAENSVNLPIYKRILPWNWGD